MSELHFLVVFDTESRGFHLEDMDSAPVDSDERVWDADTDQWRIPTEVEADLELACDSILIDALRALDLPVKS